MKKRLILALPEVYSLRGNDYSRFLVMGGAHELMKDNWNGVGTRLGQAMGKVGNVVRDEKTKTSGTTSSSRKTEHSACSERRRGHEK